LPQRDGRRFALGDVGLALASDIGDYTITVGREQNGCFAVCHDDKQPLV
jgi:hypothetical protein